MIEFVFYHGEGTLINHGMTDARDVNLLVKISEMLGLNLDYAACHDDCTTGK